MATRGLVALKVTCTYAADLVYWKVNDRASTASVKAELGPIGFAGHPIQQFDLREKRYVGAEQ